MDSYPDMAAKVDLIHKKRFTIHALAVVLLLTIAYTHDVALFGIGALCTFTLSFLPPILLSVARNQAGAVSLLSAQVCLFLDRIFPLPPKKHTGLLQQLAVYLFSQARESGAAYHSRQSPDEVRFLREAPAMSLAEGLLKEAQAYEAYFVKSDPADRREHLRNVAVAHEELGYLYRCQSKFDEAIEHLTEAMSLAQEIGDADLLGLIKFRLAEIDHVQGRHASAVAGYRASILLFRQVGNRRDLRWALDFLKELSDDGEEAG